MRVDRNSFISIPRRSTCSLRTATDRHMYRIDEHTSYRASAATWCFSHLYCGFCIDKQVLVADSKKNELIESNLY